MTRFRLTTGLALASLMGAALIAGPALAQSPPQKPPAAQAATSSKPETVEQRIASLKTSLKITPEQEAQWTAVATAMRDNAGAMDKLVQAKRAKAQAGMTAVEDMQTYLDFSQAHADGMKNLIPVFKTLYDSMPADQKKNADQVFQTFGPAKSGSQG